MSTLPGVEALRQNLEGRNTPPVASSATYVPHKSSPSASCYGYATNGPSGARPGDASSAKAKNAGTATAILSAMKDVYMRAVSNSCESLTQLIARDGGKQVSCSSLAAPPAGQRIISVHAKEGIGYEICALRPSDEVKPGEGRWDRKPGKQLAPTDLDARNKPMHHPNHFDLGNINPCGCFLVPENMWKK